VTDKENGKEDDDSCEERYPEREFDVHTAVKKLGSNSGNTALLYEVGCAPDYSRIIILFTSACFR